MWFLFLAGCYERMVVELRVDARHGCVEVTEEQQGWDAQIGEEACASATACLTAIQARLHEERTRLATNGAQEVTNGVFLRDGELGFRTRYRARLDAPIFTEGGYLDRVQILDRNARPRDVVAIWEGPPEQGSRMTVTGTGHFLAYRTRDHGTLWVFPRGRGTAHLVVQLLTDDGTDAMVEPWVAGFDGLWSAVEAAGLVSPD